MSYRTSLGLKYSDASQLAETLNSEILLLKKALLADEQVGLASQQDLERTQLNLAKFLRNLVNCLKTGKVTSKQTVESPIPDDLIKRLEKRHLGRLEYFLEDLESVIHILEKGEAIGDRNIEILDEVANAADASASASFRRMWRR